MRISDAKQLSHLFSSKPFLVPHCLKNEKDTKAFKITEKGLWSSGLLKLALNLFERNFSTLKGMVGRRERGGSGGVCCFKQDAKRDLKLREEQQTIVNQHY